MLFAAVGTVCILISVFSYEILYVLSSNPVFVQAWMYIPFIAIGLFIVFVGQMLSLPVYFSKRTKFFFLSNLAGFIVIVSLTFFLIPQYGINGAIFAKVFGFFTMTIVQYIFAINCGSSPYSYSQRCVSIGTNI